jgi:hypothetical protein
VTEGYMPASSSFCNRQARVSALIRVSCGWGPRLSALSRCRRAGDALPAAAALEPHWDAHDQRAAVEPGLDAALHAAFLSPRCRSSAAKLTSPLGPDPHLEGILLHVDPLDEQLDDAGLLGWEMSGPHSRPRGGPG